MKIVFLDVKTIGEDIDLSAYDELGEVVKYSFSSPEEVPARVTDADVIILNKVPVNEQTIGTAKNLKLVCVTATGTNNLDKEYLDSKGIAWRNVAGYSTETVAQHTFAMLLFLLEKLRYYGDYVKEERYVNDVSFTHFAEHFTEIHGKPGGSSVLGQSADVLLRLHVHLERKSFTTPPPVLRRRKVMNRLTLRHCLRNLILFPSTLHSTSIQKD